MLTLCNKVSLFLCFLFDFIVTVLAEAMIVLYCLIGSLYGHIMGEQIRCWNKDTFDYHAYEDQIWKNDPKYINNGEGALGDVCDHETNGEIKDMCYFEVYLGAERWDYKCIHHSDCPKKDAITGEGIIGCVQFENKQISCCCKEDFCNGQYQELSKLGYADNFDPNAQIDYLGDESDGDKNIQSNDANHDFEADIYSSSKQLQHSTTIINQQWLILIMFMLTVFNTILICKFQFCDK